MRNEQEVLRGGSARTSPASKSAVLWIVRCAYALLGPPTSQRSPCLAWLSPDFQQRLRGVPVSPSAIRAGIGTVELDRGIAGGGRKSLHYCEVCVAPGSGFVEEDRHYTKWYISANMGAAAGPMREGMRQEGCKHRCNLGSCRGLQPRADETLKQTEIVLVREEQDDELSTLSSGNGRHDDGDWDEAM